MALVLADRVQETTTTTGTGTVTLLGAVTGYQSFAAVGNANTTYYCIAGQTGSEWEVGIGTYTSAGTTLARTTVLSSSNAGSAVNFSAGTKNVFVTYAAGRSLYSNGVITTNATYYLTFSATNAAGTQEISTATALTFNPSTGALTSTTVTSSSDERLKTNWRDLPPNFVRQLAQIKHGTYDRTDQELTQDGVSAQSLQPLLPNSVLEGADGKLSVAYGNAALVSAIELAQLAVAQEARIAKLEALVAQLMKR
jgi:hypothetical protein